MTEPIDVCDHGIMTETCSKSSCHMQTHLIMKNKGTQYKERRPQHQSSVEVGELVSGEPLSCETLDDAPFVCAVTEDDKPGQQDEHSLVFPEGTCAIFKEILEKLSVLDDPGFVT